MFHFSPSKAIQVIVCCALTCIAVLCIWGGGGVTGPGIAPKNWSILNVFQAAPFNWTEAPRGRAHSIQLKAPPAYVNTDALITHFSQSIPSSAWSSPPMPPPIKRAPKGGTTGSTFSTTKPARWDACTSVEVWMSESAKNMQQAPATNDP